MEYFSDVENGQVPRTIEVIPANVWAGISVTIESLIDSGAFGGSFPASCPDGAGPIGTDRQSFILALKAEVPAMNWPSWGTPPSSQGQPLSPEASVPETLAVLDFVQFCYAHVAKPIQGGYHDFFRHHHLSFDHKAGRNELRERINRVFARNGVAFELRPDGSIARLLSPTLERLIRVSRIASGDLLMDQMLDEACTKLVSPDPRLRKEAVERLWDVWERLKSLNEPSNKKRSITQLLQKAASEPNFQALLDDEARKLTEIGNAFHIRHTEVGQTPIVDTQHLDYLFHRLFALISLLLRSESQ